MKLSLTLGWNKDLSECDSSRRIMNVRTMLNCILIETDFVETVCFYYVRVYKTPKRLNMLKGKRQAKDQMNALYFLNGICNANYVLHCKFLTENGIDLQKFINLGRVIEKILNKKVFLYIFSYFYSQIIVCFRSGLNSIVSE